MTFFLEGLLAVAGGVLSAKCISTLPHRLRVLHYTRALLNLSRQEHLQLALEGNERIFSKENRDWLVELSFAKDVRARTKLCRRIAEDTADRWREIATGRGLEMKSMMSESDCRAIEEARLKFHELARASQLAKQTGNEGSAIAVRNHVNIRAFQVELNDVGGGSVTVQRTAPHQRPEQK